MAKNKIHPEGYRLGKTINWNSNIKLQFYKKNVRSSVLFSEHFKQIFWWQNKKYLNKKKMRKFTKLPVIKFLEKGIQVDSCLNYRRRQIKFNFITCLQGFYLYPKLYDFRATKFEGYIGSISLSKKKKNLINFKNFFLLNNIGVKNYWESNSTIKSEISDFIYKFLKLRSSSLLLNLSKFKLLKLITIDDKEILYEKRLVYQRNILEQKFLYYQRLTPYVLNYFFQNYVRGLRGSTSLRRYQYCLDCITPSDWYKSIKLKTKSYKKIVGSLNNNIYTPDIALATSSLSTNLNIALHWHSSLIFAKTLALLVEQKKGASGFLRLFGGALNRLQILRFNVTCICINIKGSFGKITRTKVIRLGKNGILQKKNLTTFDQLVSYTNVQSITRRGVLGISVWLYWT